MRSRTVRRASVALWVALAALSVACVEADKGPPAPPASPPSPGAASGAAGTETAAAAAPAPLEASEVPRAAILAEMRLRAIRSLVSRSRETDAIAAAAPSLFEAIDRLEKEARARAPRQQTVRALRSVSREWRNHADLLRSWMSAAERRLDALLAARDEIRALSATWSATEADLISKGSAPEIVEPVRVVLVSTREIAREVQKGIDSVVALESRIADRRLDAEDALDEIAAAAREQRKGVFKVDGPPLWRASGASPAGGSLASEVAAAMDESARALREYAERAGRNLNVHLLVFAALVAGFWRLRRRAASWPGDDRGVRACAAVVGRPWIGAWLVAILVAPWIHPRAPLAVVEGLGVLLLPPVLFVMTGIVERRMWAPLWALAAVFLGERVWALSWEGSLLERLVLLAIAAISAAALLWATGPGARIAEALAGRWRGAAIALGRAGLLVLAVAAASNVAGGVSLARLLTSLVVRSAYLAVVLYAAALLVRGALSLLLSAGALGGVRTLARYRDVIRSRGTVAIDLAAVALWLFAVAANLGIQSVLRDEIGGFLGRQWGIGTVRFSFGTAIVFVATVYVSVLVSRLLRAVLEEDVFPRVELPRGAPATLTTVVRYGAITLGFLLALAVAGIPIDRLTIVFGALGVGIGFGLQTIVNNFLSGLILMFEKPIQVGDTVEVGGLSGRVRRIGVRASTIETFDGAEVIVPNGTLVSDQLVNWTLSHRSRRVEIEVGVAYGSDPRRVIALLREAALSHPGTLREPAPEGLFRGFGDSSLDFSLRFWTGDFEEWMRLRSEVAVRVHEALVGAGVEIPFPQRDVHIRSGG